MSVNKIIDSHPTKFTYLYIFFTLQCHTASATCKLLVSYFSDHPQ